MFSLGVITDLYCGNYNYKAAKITKCPKVVDI